MAAKGSTWANQLLKLVFQAVAVPNLADDAASSPLTNLYVSLHTATPGAGGNQGTNEAAYTGYARQAVARSAGGWTVSANSVSPAANIVFPAATGGTETETFFGIGTALTGAGELLAFGPITPNIPVAVPVAPQLTTSSAYTES